MAGNQLSIPFEEWKVIPGFSGYEASTHGRVRSYWKHKSLGIGQGSISFIDHNPQRFMSPARGKKGGYFTVRLRDVFGKYHTNTINRIILITFIGPCPKGMECCHNDGNDGNNFLYNLRWDTHTKNTYDRKKHGTEIMGEKHYMSKLTDDQVRQIRKMSNEGYSNAQINKVFSNITNSNIFYIVCRKTWKHI